MKVRKSLVAVSLALLVVLALNITVAQAAPGWQPGGFFYTVRPGDTLFSIAVRYNSTVWSIAQANRLYNPSMIFSGQVLLIPAGGPAPIPGPVPGPIPGPMPGPVVHIVRHGETLFSIAQFYGLNVWSIARANGLMNPNYIFTGQRLMIPVSRPAPIHNPGYNPGYNTPWQNTPPQYPTYWGNGGPWNGGSWNGGSWNGGYNPYQTPASW